MTKEQMEQVVQRQLDAYNRRDLMDFCACYHPEVTIQKLTSNELICKGIDQFKVIYQALFESSPKLYCALKNRIVLESAVLDEEFVTGAAPFPNGLHTVAFYGFRDSLIDRVWFYR